MGRVPAASAVDDSGVVSNVFTSGLGGGNVVTNLNSNTNNNLGGETFNNNYFNDKYITLEEPRVKLFTGKFDSHNSNGFSGQTYDMPDYYGTYNACFKTFGNDCVGSKTMNNDITKMQGLWVPPNKYVYLYDKYEGDLGSIADANLSKDNNGAPINYQIEWEEGEEQKYKKFCPNVDSGETPVKIFNAKFQCIDDSRNLDITNHKYVKNKLGISAAAWVWPYNNLREFFDDPCYGVKKKVVLNYNCGYGGNWLPAVNPNGNYTPGYYSSLEDVSDPSLNSLLSKDNYNPSLKYPNNNNNFKSIVIRPINADNGNPKQWRDHLAKCCSGEINNKTLCGSFMPNHKEGAKSCSFLLDEKINNERKYLTIDDIKDISDDGKTPIGKYSWICKNNPAVCDNIKNEFCAKNPTSSWCKCINASDQPEFKNLANRLNQANMSNYIDKCMIESCRTDDSDLTKNFIPSNQLGKDCPNPETIQQTIVSGSGNVLSNLAQSVNNIRTPTMGTTTNNQHNNQQTTQQPITVDIDNKKMYLYMGIVFVFILLIIIIISISNLLNNKKKDKKNNNYNETDE